LLLQKCRLPHSFVNALKFSRNVTCIKLWVQQEGSLSLILNRGERASVENHMRSRTFCELQVGSVQDARRQ
jgi:hypothetical protein